MCDLGSSHEEPPVFAHGCRFGVLYRRTKARDIAVLHYEKRGAHVCASAGAASQFFCQPRSEDANGDEDECVYRDDTLVLLELTTRDMMEARAASGYELSLQWL